MSMKKILASVAASTIALAAMSVSAFAVDMVTGDGVNGTIDNGNFVYDLLAVGEDFETISEFKVVLKPAEGTEDGWGGGIMLNGTKCGWTQDDANWSYCNPDADKALKGVDNGDGTYTVTLTFDAGQFGTAADKDADPKFYAQIVMQQWWGDPLTILSVNGVPSLEADSEDTEDGDEEGDTDEDGEDGDEEDGEDEDGEDEDGEDEDGDTDEEDPATPDPTPVPSPIDPASTEDISGIAVKLGTVTSNGLFGDELAKLLFSGDLKGYDWFDVESIVFVSDDNVISLEYCDKTGTAVVASKAAAVRADDSIWDTIWALNMADTDTANEKDPHVKLFAQVDAPANVTAYVTLKKDAAPDDGNKPTGIALAVAPAALAAAFVGVAVVMNKKKKG